MVNLFAWRTPDPKELAAGTAVGFDNDRRIESARDRAGIIVCAWGGSVPNACRPRVGRVISILKLGGILLCLGRTKTGDPRHPLYLKGSQPLERFA